MTDTMGRMHSDAQFAGSSSVPAHVEMMGFLGIGNNPMVGCTVASSHIDYIQIEASVTLGVMEAFCLSWAMSFNGIWRCLHTKDSVV